MADEPKDTGETPTPPQAAADKPASRVPGEPLKGEVSRAESPGAGVSAAKPAPPAAKPAAPGVPNAAAALGAPAERKPAAVAAYLPADPPPPADLAVPKSVQAVHGAFPGAVERVSYWVGDWTIIIPADKLLDIGRFLRDTPDFAFDFCSDVTASDYPSRPQRFDVVYCLYSTRHRTRLRIKVRAGERDPVPSVTSLWPAANWLEREVYDLFGVNFTGHPDRRRILMPEDWQGYPQRKDYPLEGPGELLMENPLDWLRLKQAHEEADIE